MFRYTYIILHLYTATIIVQSNNETIKDGTLRFVATHSFAQIKGTETQNFVELLKSDFYVDKTILLETTIVNSYKYKTILITLPSKWGKSLNLNMMKTFFEIQVDELGNRISPLENTTNYRLFRRNELVTEDNEVRKLARPLFISENNNLLVKYQGQYPVIYLDFQNVSGSNYADFMQQVGKKMKEAFTQHGYLIGVLLKEFNEASTPQTKTNAKEKYDFFLNILSEKSNTKELVKSLELLSRILYDHFDAKVFILVDNYESIILNGLINDEISESELSSILDFFSSLMLRTLQSNDYLHTGILTGTLQMLNLVPNLTNIIECTETYHRITTSYGITNEDLVNIFKYFQIPSNLTSKVINWYKGYRRGENLKHNFYSLHSVMSFLSNKNVHYYKTRNIAIDKILDTALESSKMRISLLWLLYGEASWCFRKTKIGQNLDDFFELKKFLLNVKSMKNYDYLTKFNILQSYLRGAGILALRSLIGDSGLTLRIPNNEVRMEVSDKLINFYQRRFQLSSELLNKAVKNMNSFISDKDTHCIHLINFLQSLIKNKSLMDDLARARQDDQQSVELFFCFIFNYLTFQITLSRHEYQIQSTDEIKSNNYIIFSDQRAIFIQFRFNATSVDSVLDICKKHANTVPKFDHFEEYKFIGINLKTNGVVQITSQFKAGPLKIDRNTEPKSQEKVCFSPYSCCKPVIFPQ